MDANKLPAAAAAGTVAATRADAAAALARRDRFRLGEALPWVIGLAAYLVFPNQMVLGGQTLIMILFALSLDLILGYGGVVTLGHAAYFGVGAYAAALLVTISTGPNRSPGSPSPPFLPRSPASFPAGCCCAIAGWRCWC